MSAVRLELRGLQKVDNVAADPDPDWSLDALLSELNALEKKLSASSKSAPFTKNQPQKSVGRNSMAFVMHLSDGESEGSESEGEEDHHPNLVVENRFNCADLYASESDDSDSEWALDAQASLMDEVGLVEGALFERSHEYQLGVKEEIRNQIAALETQLLGESEKSASAFARIEKYKEARREFDRKFDTQYQRKIAEALDNHLTAIQRDHELKSQIEERRIRSDAAHEEAKRKEKALQEERLRQERARAEAEAKLRAEEAKIAALEAERRVAKEAAEKEAAEASKRITDVVSKEAEGKHVNASLGNLDVQGSLSKGIKKPQSAGDIVKAAESALIIEQGRLQKLKELNEGNLSLMSNSNMDFRHESHIARLVKTIRGMKENVRTRADELVKILKNPSFPQSVSIAAFVRKVVSYSRNLNNSTAFGFGNVIVLVTSQVPHAMDLLLAEFHGACIYTVPKHIVYSKSVFESKEAYYKAIGFEENDGKIENVKDYLKRVESYMKLYGVLVQTEIQGSHNFHGPKEGWAWLARFLNTLPANMYTAVALNAFLQMAGFVLFKKYKSQFGKLLKIISNDFLKALKEREDSELKPIIAEIESYILDKKFLQEPEGRNMQNTSLSSVMASDTGQYYY